MIKIFILVCIPVLLACSKLESRKEDNKGNASEDRYLLLDSRIVAQVENAKLVVGKVKKDRRNPLFVEDREWEKRFDNLYGNVIYDYEEGIYKCWYSPFIEDMSAQGMDLAQRQASYDPPENREMGICYATSKDGIGWVKPEMGMVEYNGSKANNILWRGDRKAGEFWEGPHGSGIFKDLRGDNPDRRYKAIIKGSILSVAFSSDGLNWSPPIPCPDADAAGDTHNNAFWAPTLEKYVGFTREWGQQPDSEGSEGKRWRQVARIESQDFVRWSKAEVVLEGLSKDLQTYAMPVFYYAGVYLGLVAIHDISSDRVWTELTWSPDTKTWYRISPGTPLIPNSDRVLDYDYGCVYACATPVFLNNEIRLYYGGSDYLHYGWRNGSLCLATLRPDGFAGYEQEVIGAPGSIITTTIPYAGQDVHLTADVAPGGYVKVSALDLDGKEIAVAEQVTITVTDAQLKWSKKLETNKLKLRFELDKAKLYSFGFGG